MPVKPENAARYPKDWPAISRDAKERAGWRCVHTDEHGSRCRASQYAVGFWRMGVFLPSAEAGATFKESRQHAAELYHSLGEEGDRPTVIVLTTAHLDHQPENCALANLAPMCQRHHLAYDHHHHRANAQATRRAKAGTLELFE
jgi:hypothetical protein